MGEFFRIAIHGYDQREVEDALSARDRRIQRLEREAQRLSELLIEQEKHMRDVLAEAGRSGARWRLFGGPSVRILLRTLDQLHSDARHRAARIRLRALREAVHVADRIIEIAQIQDELGFTFAELAERAGIRIDPPERGGRKHWSSWRGSGEAGGSSTIIPDAPHDGDTEGEREGSWPSSVMDQPIGMPPTDGLHTGTVQVEIGPLRDFAQLTSVEDAIGAVEGVGEVEVENFSNGRAHLAVTLWEPTPLVEDLQFRVALPLELKAEGATRIIFNVIESDEAAG